MTTATSSGSVHYLLATFPTLTETFVVGEVAELCRQGVPISLFALRPSRAAVQRPDAHTLVAETTFA